MPDRIEVSPGVFHRIERGIAFYSGTADAMVASGILRPTELPGQHGNPMSSVTVNPDGSRGSSGSNRFKGKLPGKKTILARYRKAYMHVEVRLNLSPQRVEAIEAERLRAASCWPFPVVIGATVTARKADRQFVGQALEVLV